MINTSAHKSVKNHPSISDDIENAVQVLSLSVDYYLHEEIHMRVHPVVNRNRLLCDIDDTHFSELTESFRYFNYDYSSGIMTWYFSFTVNNKGASYATSVPNFDAYSC